MLYLLDANVLIDAARYYYPLDRVPEFWDWLRHNAELGHIKLPLEMFEEIITGDDALAEWVKNEDVKRVLVLDEDAAANLVGRVVAEGYAVDLTDDEVTRVGRDPFLIAYALQAPTERSVVTTEASKPTRVRANRHVPDVCATFSIPTVSTFDLIQVLGFTTSWRRASE